MRILITGANGLVGRVLLEKMAATSQWEIFATSRGEHRVSHFNYHYFSADLTNESDIDSLIRAVQPHVLVHSAAITQVDVCELQREQALRTNVEAVHRLVRMLQPYRTHFIYLSTDFVFDGQKGMYTETDIPNPINFYGFTKAEAEKIVENSGLPFNVVRTVLVYGILPNMSRQNILTWIIHNLEARKPIRVVNDQWRTPTYVEDLANGLKLLARLRPVGYFNLAGSEYLTPYQFALRVAEIFDLDSSLISPTYAHEFKETGTRPFKTGLKINKAQEILGYQPTPLNESLICLRDWYRAHRV
ncbi:MAG: SDR family oxidoreductase [Cytophagales bacterium]|nr:SDR family oxidoreductase [Cytophagales bacterium]MDW8385265.1 SDR family oxidoreductase [Flammeovirgaceae bacterium]